MKQMKLIQGRTPAEFVYAYNNAIAELSGSIISEQFLSNTLAYLFYEMDETEERVEEIRRRAEEEHNRSIVECTVEDGPHIESFETEVIEIKIKAGVPIGHYCCECDNYVWKQGCPYRKGRIDVMDEACGMFNVIIERR